ncbi:MAG: tRNA (adenosine(37)-N6)-threonylcarbamoyltransferase complex dimerization subunit type 1 TsaB [Treponema sp.]|nr:tRNA (adenosine(37)-N6)-threonylcarbamoyltransferase complex dimerization subunit type 1 TsaB [Treponema sp.]
MKALVIDSAASCMTICAKNENEKVSLSIDLGMKQSKKLLPAIDYVLKEVELAPKDLDYTALCSGPGTFTGLRLAFSALKAIELAHDVPVYGIRTLDAYAEPFLGFSSPVVSVVDAKKDQFFVSLYNNGTALLESADTNACDVCSEIKKHGLDSRMIFVAGADAKIFAEKLLSIEPTLQLACFDEKIDVSQSLFNLAEKAMALGESPLKDYDGPLYFRKSEAELNLENSAK